MTKKKFKPLDIKPPRSREERRYEAKEREYSKLESTSDRILADLLKGNVTVTHVDEIKASLWLQSPENLNLPKKLKK